MAKTGSVNVDLQMTGSAIRLRALELSIGSSERPVTTEGILKRAEAYERYVERGKPEEASVVSEEKPVGMPTPWIVSVAERLQGAIISPVDAEYLISAVKARTRN